MLTLDLKLHPAVCEKFEDFVAGGFLATGLDSVSPELAEVAAEEMVRAREELMGQGLNIQNLADDDRIKAWREAYRRSGLKPSTYKSSAEQLGRRLLRGDLINTPLPLVTVYCAVAARHLSAMGAYDLSSLPQRQVEIRFANVNSDSFTPLAGATDDMKLGPDVVVYASGSEVLCYSFNHRDSRKTCLAPNTTAAVFLGEGVTGVGVAAAQRALGEMVSILQRAGAQTGEIGFVSGRLLETQLTIGSD